MNHSQLTMVKLKFLKVQKWYSCIVTEILVNGAVTRLSVNVESVKYYEICDTSIGTFKLDENGLLKEVNPINLTF